MHVTIAVKADAWCKAEIGESVALEVVRSRELSAGKATDCDKKSRLLEGSAKR